MTSGKRRIPINNHESRGAQLHTPGESTAPSVNHAEGEEREVAQHIGQAAPEADTVCVAETGAAAEESPVREVKEGSAGAVEEALRERDALADSLVRLRAEFDNYRKRVARDLIEARSRAQGELLNDLLPVLDNLERALDAAEHHDEGKVLGGVRMTRDMFTDLLRRAGVEEIETVGTQFDPQVHDAVLLQVSDDEEGMVTSVLERGYRQGDRVLRPARVAVSAGPDGAANAG